MNVQKQDQRCLLYTTKILWILALAIAIATQPAPAIAIATRPALSGTQLL